jgi:APA family basic amino acid/polyamine antiporter
LTIIGIFILRKKKPQMERPYKAFGYPVLPILYIILGLTFCVFLAIFEPVYSLWGMAIVLVGIPLYFIAISSRKS